jgi:predicted DCC family thiol-disulfide oxidoreductase YuxK
MVNAVVDSKRQYNLGEYWRILNHIRYYYLKAFFMPAQNSQRAIILFDGVCNLCNGFVQFVINNDKQRCFKFAALQSEAGESVLSELLRDQKNLPDSVILIEDQQLYFKSEAAIRILSKLRGPVKHLAYSKFLPLWLRDPVYDFIARNRYRWFGKKESCMMPDPDVVSRFL